MAAVDWARLETYVQSAYEANGRIERADVMDLAYGEDADDEIVDALDAIGSRVFNSPDDVRAFLVGQHLVNE